jgi:hypothetical protein
VTAVLPALVVDFMMLLGVIRNLLEWLYLNPPIKLEYDQSDLERYKEAKALVKEYENGRI